MAKDIFKTAFDLDTDFLDDVYENDTDTAITIFEQYLQDLPTDLRSISESFNSGDKKQFVGLIHKKKVAFSYVGLTDVTARMSELENKCTTAEDLKPYTEELQSLLQRISSSEDAIRTILDRLKQQES